MTYSDLPEMSGSRRCSWATIPAWVHSWVEECVGASVVDAIDQSGGFSEGLAARVVLGDGGTAFVKAVHASSAPGVANFHRAEVEISASLPASVPAPRLLGSCDEGGWVVLVFTEVSGRLPTQPWQGGELRQVLDALTGLAETLTPAPRLAVTSQPRLGGWRNLAESPTAIARLHDIAPDTAADLGPHLELEAGLDEVLVGDTLVHGDLYAFNVLLTETGVMFVDWAHAWIGPQYADLVMLLGGAASVGIDPEPLAARHPLLRGIEKAAVNTLISAQAGFLLSRACTASLEADPNLIAAMTKLGLGSLQWFASRQ